MYTSTLLLSCLAGLSAAAPQAISRPPSNTDTIVLAPTIPALPPSPAETSYVGTGKLQKPEPAPYTPAGGLGTNGSAPVYLVESDFDFESIVSTGPKMAV
jgi:hypothetical protein